MKNYELLLDEETFSVTWKDGDFSIFIDGEWYFDKYDELMEFANVDIHVTSSYICNDNEITPSCEYIYSEQFLKDLRLQVEEEVNTDLNGYNLAGYLERNDDFYYMLSKEND